MLMLSNQIRECVVYNYARIADFNEQVSSILYFPAVIADRLFVQEKIFGWEFYASARIVHRLTDGDAQLRCGKKCNVTIRSCFPVQTVQIVQVRLS